MRRLHHPLLTTTLPGFLKSVEQTPGIGASHQPDGIASLSERNEDICTRLDTTQIGSIDIDKYVLVHSGPCARETLKNDPVQCYPSCDNCFHRSVFDLSSTGAACDSVRGRSGA